MFWLEETQFRDNEGAYYLCIYNVLRVLISLSRDQTSNVNNVSRLDTVTSSLFDFRGLLMCINNCLVLLQVH